jgi:methionine-rich copper-binding protein CopC
MILNGGVDGDTTATIIPTAELNVITSAHSIVDSSLSPGISTDVYGLGWSIFSIVGHNVSGN